MSNTLPSKRAFLASHTDPATGKPFADNGPGARGRFSRAAEAFAAEHTDKWAEPVKVVKAPKAPKPEAAPVPAVSQTVVQTGQVNPKEVRAWAQQNGHEVGARGRIKPEVVAAFLKAGGKATVPTAKRPTPLDMPKVRPNKQAWAIIQAKKDEGPWAKPFVLGVENCGKGHRIQSCTCARPTTSKEFGNAPLLLTKPRV